MISTLLCSTEKTLSIYFLCSVPSLHLTADSTDRSEAVLDIYRFLYDQSINNKKKMEQILPATSETDRTVKTEEMEKKVRWEKAAHSLLCLFGFQQMICAAKLDWQAPCNTIYS